MIRLGARHEATAAVATFTSMIALLACGASEAQDAAGDVPSFAGMLTPDTPAAPASPAAPGETGGMPVANTPGSEGTQGEIPLTGAPGEMGTTPAMTPPAMTPAEMTPPESLPPVVPVATGYPENTGAECGVTAGALSRNENLPDPFAMNDGTRITTRAQWTCRRNEIKKDVERYEIGAKPEPPSVSATLNGNQLNVAVSTEAGSLTLTSNTSTPAGAGPHCVAIGMNGNSSLISGCVQVPFLHNQVVTYNQNSNVDQNDPFYDVYPDRFGNISNYAAWSWGISRIIDGLEQVQEQLNVDLSRVGVHGCSYAGKMALFGGAFDERVALTVVQESGGGGINSWRLSQNFTTRTGTNIEKIDNTNYSWFLRSMESLDPYSLPHDHHELIAMIAPRAVVALGNRDFEWLGDESGYQSILAAREVWRALGAEASIGFDFTTDHGHCQAPQIQVNSVNAFVNQFLRGQDANTNIAIPPPVSGENADDFDLDVTQVIDWTTPALQ